VIRIGVRRHHAQLHSAAQRLVGGPGQGITRRRPSIDRNDYRRLSRQVELIEANGSPLAKFRH
jgi:hypothetical protein